MISPRSITISIWASSHSSMPCAAGLGRLHGVQPTRVEPQHRNCPTCRASRAQCSLTSQTRNALSKSRLHAFVIATSVLRSVAARRLLNSSTVQHRVAGAPAGRTVHPSNSYLPRRTATQTRKGVSVDAQAQAHPRLPALDLLTSAPGVLLCLDSFLCSPTFCILASVSSVHFLAHHSVQLLVFCPLLPDFHQEPRRAS